MVKKALAIPVTYLILFASLVAIISATYSLAIVKISARSAYFRACKFQPMSLIYVRYLFKQTQHAITHKA